MNPDRAVFLVNSRLFEGGDELLSEVVVVNVSLNQRVQVEVRVQAFCVNVRLQDGKYQTNVTVVMKDFVVVL